MTIVGIGGCHGQQESDAARWFPGIIIERTFEGALSRPRDDDVKVAQVVLMWSGTDSGRGISDKTFSFLEGDLGTVRLGVWETRRGRER